jgi:group I intron endonuclease
MNNKLYCLKCPYTLEIRYIGITNKDLKGRLSRHIHESKYRDNHKSNWIRKLMSDNKIPIIELIIDGLEYEESLNIEIEYIKKYRDMGFNLVNISDGGDFNPSKLQSVRDKISKKLTGIKRSDETKQKLRISHIGISKGDKNPFFNKKHTDISRKKMSNSVKLSFNNPDMIRKLSSLKDAKKIPIIQLDMNDNFIREWESVSMIKRELKFERKTIKLVCQGKYKQAYGFKWKFK